MKTYKIKVDREFDSFMFMMKSQDTPTQGEMATALQSKHYVNPNEEGLEMSVDEVID